MVQTQFQENIQVFRSDNRKEYFNTILGKYFLENGIVHQSSCNDTPQHGAAERKNKHGSMDVTFFETKSYFCIIHLQGSIKVKTLILYVFQIIGSSSDETHVIQPDVMNHLLPVHQPWKPTFQVLKP